MEHKIDTSGINPELLKLLPQKKVVNNDKNHLEAALIIFENYLKFTANTGIGLQSKLKYIDLMMDRCLYSYICYYKYDIPSKFIGIVLNRTSENIGSYIRRVFKNGSWLTEAELKYSKIKNMV